MFLPPTSAVGVLIHEQFIFMLQLFNLKRSSPVNHFVEMYIHEHMTVMLQYSNSEIFLQSVARQRHLCRCNCGHLFTLNPMAKV